MVFLVNFKHTSSITHPSNLILLRTHRGAFFFWGGGKPVPRPRLAVSVSKAPQEEILSTKPLRTITLEPQILTTDLNMAWTLRSIRCRRDSSDHCRWQVFGFWCFFFWLPDYWIRDLARESCLLHGGIGRWFVFFFGWLEFRPWIRKFGFTLFLVFASWLEFMFTGGWQIYIVS